MASWKIHSQVQVAAYSEWNIAVPFSSWPKVMVGQNKFYFLKSYFGNIQKGKYAIKILESVIETSVRSIMFHFY